MAEATDEEKGSTRFGNRQEVQPPNVSFPLIICISLTAFLIVGVSAFFQAQLMSLQRELESLQLRLPPAPRDEDRPKALKKRSSGKSEDEAVQESGIQAAHFQGSFPFQHIEKQGRIGPWYLTSTGGSFVRMRAKGTEVEVLRSGVYYIYAQVYYLTSHPHNSYQIMSYNGTEERKRHRNVVTCSSQGRDAVGEVSCHTGLVRSLEAGERLYLNQVEQDRMIHFTDGCSFFGVVLLRKSATFNRGK